MTALKTRISKVEKAGSDESRIGLFVEGFGTARKKFQTEPQADECRHTYYTVTKVMRVQMV